MPFYFNKSSLTNNQSKKATPANTPHRQLFITQYYV